MSGTHYVSKAELETNNYLRKIQTGLVKRLYDNEKHKFLSQTNGFAMR
jgi:hypothetical protein